MKGEAADVVVGLRGLGVATVYEASGRRGLVDAPLERVVPGSRAAGPARTALCGQGDNLAVHAALARVQPGEVLVLAMPEPVALVGEVIALQAKVRGAAGLLIDGAIRDADELSELGLPIWARFVHARGAAKEEAGGLDVPVSVGGVRVEPGDMVVMDGDGAVVVPAGSAEEVLDAGRRRLVKADLLRRHPNSGTVGRHSTPVEVILRMLIVKRLYGWSYAQTERFVNDSIVLRQFTRLYLERSPDDTTLIRWANTIGSETVASLNDRAVELARSLKVTRGRKLRIDGTVVETNIHHPTDDTLISDGVRVIGRLLRGAKSFVEQSVLSEHKGEPFRNRTRSAKRLAHKISKMALRRSQEAKADLRAAYQRLLEVGKATLKQAGGVRDLLGESPSARKVADEISRFSELLEWAVGQARRRVLEGERLEAEEKLLSLFEEHTVVIRRGKARKQTEFGRKVWLSEVEGGIVSGFAILEGNSGDEAQLKPSLEDHLRLFDKPPELVAADRNVHSKDNERLAKGFGVKKVCLPKAGKKSALREEYEGQGWYKRARRFRAGIEGRISVMKRRQYLGRCRDKGEEGFGRWVGWGVLTSNLEVMARKLAA